MDLQLVRSIPRVSAPRNRNHLDIARSLTRGALQDLLPEGEEPTREQLLAAQRGLEGALTFLGRYREAQ